ncbi:hypothetical protein ScPMuIL_004658 [Solemya velum]
MSVGNDAYDAALIGILQNEGQITNFLDAILGFLYRRTDFYRVMRGERDAVGFPPGVSARLLLTAHKKYEKLASDDVKRQEKRNAAVTVQSTQYFFSDTNPPPAVTTVEVKTETKKTENTTTEPEKTNENKTVDNIKSSKTEPLTENAKGDGNSQTSPANKQINSASPEATTGASEEVEDPEITKQQRVFQENPESYNGAIRDNYSWSQSITDLDIRVNVPKHIKKGRDVKVDIGRKTLSVSYKSAEGWEQVVSGDLCWEIHKEDCIWSLVPGEHVHINFEKVEERWWEAFFVSEPKINVRKIDASRPMTDLDDEAQTKIEEMMYNDRQKKMGLPQSHEKKVHDVLKQAWDAEGSPFKGQEFDPSKFSVDPSGVVSMNQT